ncbi:hypothetical protein EFT36_16795 [Raoultella ornithinolytica]|nr:hypothetical protein EFT36_16795 [Raoultella ornithinolytica]
MTWLSPCGLVQCGYIPVILQAACALIGLLGSFMSFTLAGRRDTAFNSVPDRFVPPPVNDCYKFLGFPRLPPSCNSNYLG